MKQVIVLALVAPLLFLSFDVDAQERAGKRSGDLFDRLDKNGDGVITRDELPNRRARLRGEGERRKGDRNRGDRRQARRGQLQKLDKNGDGKLSADEAPRLFKGRRQLDANGDGFITSDELRRRMQKRAVRAIPRRLKQMDADGDGRITADEFKGNERLFQRLDRNQDGVIDVQDRRRRGEQGDRKGKGKRRRPPQEADV